MGFCYHFQTQVFSGGIGIQRIAVCNLVHIDTMTTKVAVDAVQSLVVVELVDFRNTSK